MKLIPLSSLQPGTVTSTEYYTESGELLLSKGITITQQHIDTITRRNILELYIKAGSDEEEDLEKILSADFSFDIEDDLDTEESKENQEEEALPAPPPPRTHAIPQLQNIKPGLAGLEQLKMSERASELDRKLTSGYTPDRPVGRPLRDKVTQCPVFNRSEEYKSHISYFYYETLAKLKKLLNSIADGIRVDVYNIRAIAADLIKILLNDKNLLLNMAMTESTEPTYIYHHSLNTALIAINIASVLGYNEQQVIEIGMGALTADIGMLLIPEEIYLKNDKLNEDEWYEIQKHPILGLHALERISSLPETILFIAYQSHERENGKGYPKQRSGRFIHKFSKIVQIADMFESLSSPRPYRDANIPYKAMEAIIKMTKTGLVDGEYVKALLMCTSLFPVGSYVQLSDQTVGKVVAANGTSFAKPTVSVLIDKDGNPIDKDALYQVNLAEETEMQIIRAFQKNYHASLSLTDGF